VTTAVVGADWVESQHPRDPHGEFAEVPGLNVVDKVMSLADITAEYGAEVGSGTFGRGDRVVARDGGGITVELAGDTADRPHVLFDASPAAARDVADRLDQWVADAQDYDPGAEDAVEASDNGLVDWDVHDGVMIGYDPEGDVIIRGGVTGDGSDTHIDNHPGTDLGAHEADMLAYELRNMADDAESYEPDQGEPTGVGVAFDPHAETVTFTDHDSGSEINIPNEDVPAVVAAVDELLAAPIPAGDYFTSRDLGELYTVTWNGEKVGVYSQDADDEVDFPLADWQHYRKFLAGIGPAPGAVTAAGAPAAGTGLSVAAVDVFAQRLADAVAALLRTIGRRAARMLAGGRTQGPGSGVSVDDVNPVPGVWAELVNAQLVPQVRHVWDQSAAATSALFPAPAPMPPNDSAAAYLGDASNRLVGIGTGVWSNMRDSLSDGLAADESIPQLAARVQTAAHVSVPRAQTIARTEAGMAANGASLAAAQLVDDPTMRKRWLATHDTRTREAHRHADGQMVPLTAPFMVGGEPLMFPGDPAGSPSNIINCRCAIGYHWEYNPAGDVAALTAAAWARVTHAGCTRTLCRAPLSPSPCLPLVADGFDEAKHPRGYHGRFGHGVGGGDVLRGLEALASVPAKLTPDPKGHHGHYDDATLTGPAGMGSARALSEYEGVEFGNINSLLRYDGAPVKPRVPGGTTRESVDEYNRGQQRKYGATIADIDQTMAVSPLPHDVVVHRVIRNGYSVFGQDVWFGDVSDDDWDNGVRPDLTGAAWDEYGYVSTSVNPDVPGAYLNPKKRGEADLTRGRVEMRIHVPAGTHGVQLSPATDHTEGEILLERGLRLQVVADHGEDQDGVRLLDLEVVPSTGARRADGPTEGGG
jgi:F like protein/ADP-ribosyltransferase exoenzyme